MLKFTLNLEELTVTSFDTTFGEDVESIQPTTDSPTPATRCYACP